MDRPSRAFRGPPGFAELFCVGAVLRAVVRGCVFFALRAFFLAGPVCSVVIRVFRVSAVLFGFCPVFFCGPEKRNAPNGLGFTSAGCPMELQKPRLQSFFLLLRMVSSRSFGFIWALGRVWCL